jgi:hypothetical protein
MVYQFDGKELIGIVAGATVMALELHSSALTAFTENEVGKRRSGDSEPRP